MIHPPTLTPFMDRLYLKGHLIILTLLIVFGVGWLVRCEHLPTIHCNISLMSSGATYINNHIKPEGRPITKSQGWLNHTEIAIFSPPAAGEPLSLAKFEIYNVENGTRRTAEMSAFLCGSIYGHIQFQRLLQLQNGNPAIEVRCFGDDIETIIYELIPQNDGDGYDFEPIYLQDKIRSFYSDIEISTANSNLYVINTHSSSTVLEQSLKDSTSPTALFPDLQVNRNSSISLSGDKEALAIATASMLNFYSIHEANLMTQRTTPLFGNVWQLGNLQWSADGESLLFTGRINGYKGIWILDLQSDTLRFIHPLDQNSFDVFWSPDNRYILFETNHDNDKSTPTRFEIIELAS